MYVYWLYTVYSGYNLLTILLLGISLCMMHMYAPQLFAEVRWALRLMFYYHLVDSQVIIPLTTNINHQAADQVSHQVSSSNLWLTRVSPPPSFFQKKDSHVFDDLCFENHCVWWMPPRTWWFIHLQQPGFLNVSNKRSQGIRVFEMLNLYSPTPLKPRSWAALPSINGVISPLNGLING